MSELRGVFSSMVIIIILSTLVLGAEDPYSVGKGGATSEGQTYEQPLDVIANEPGTTYDSQTNSYSFTDSKSSFFVNVPETTKVVVADGSIADFSMTNALFSLGSLVQGSFISFSDNNNIYFSSLFDASTFTATLDDQGSVEVEQRNSFGDLGRVSISLDGGNLTQDNEIVFIPNGDNPTYIYYNTTEVEFKDGTVSLLGESVTNLDATKDSSMLSFDASGFTRVELQPENTYRLFSYSIVNTGDAPVYICRNDPLCDVSIGNGSFLLHGALNFSYKEEPLYISMDEENIAEFDTSTGLFAFSNVEPPASILALLFQGHHQLTVTQEDIFDLPVAKESSTLIQSVMSSLHNQSLSFDSEGNLHAGDFHSYLPPSRAASPQKPVSLSVAILVPMLLLLLTLLIVCDLPRKRMPKKGQFSLFVVFALVLLLLLALLVYLTLSKTSSPVSESLVEIESLQQAADVVSSCEQEKVHDAFFALGEHGGYVETSFSSFGSAYELIPISAMQDDLERYLQRDLLACADLLRGSSFSLVLERPDISVSLADPVAISLASLGMVENSNGDRLAVPALAEEFPVNFPELYDLLATLLDGDYGIPVLSPDGYTVEIFTATDYNEAEIVVTDIDSTFAFHMTKVLVG